jgi:hypothetical protein
MRKIFGVTIIVLLLVQAEKSCVAQTTEWQFVNGKAFAEKQIVLSGRSNDDIYRDVSRWLVKYFGNPEEILKARIHGEYLRGEGHRAQLITSGPLSLADLRYTFVAEIANHTLTFTLTDAVLVYPGSQDADISQGGTHRAEEFFGKSDNKRSQMESDKILAALNTFSESMLNSLDASIRTPPE